MFQQSYNGAHSRCFSKLGAFALGSVPPHHARITVAETLASLGWPWKTIACFRETRLPPTTKSTGTDDLRPMVVLHLFNFTLRVVFLSSTSVSHKCKLVNDCRRLTLRQTRPWIRLHDHFLFHESIIATYIPKRKWTVICPQPKQAPRRIASHCVWQQHDHTTGTRSDIITDY